MTFLDLYDNQIQNLDEEALRNAKALENLDLSFNVIRDISPLKNVSEKLKKLYLVSNSIRTIPPKTFDHLKELTLLELGANQISVT